MASRKLRHYFQGRDIAVVTDLPLKKLLNKADMAGRLINWAVELSQFAITYIPRKAIKAQALADFVAECSFTTPESDSDTAMTITDQPIPKAPQWKLFVDGSSTATRSGAGIVMISPDGFQIMQALRFSFKATNNQAEYEAVIAGLNLATALSVRDLIIFSDS